MCSGYSTPGVLAEEANRLKSRDIGNLVGVTKAIKLLDSGRQNFPLRRLVQQIAFNVYVTTSRQLHLTHDEMDSGLSGLTKERGLRLAQAFDAAIRDTDYGRQLERRPTIDKNNAINFPLTSTTNMGRKSNLVENSTMRGLPSPRDIGATPRTIMSQNRRGSL